MAKVCSRCHKAHPEGAITCAQAAEAIKRDAAELQHDVRHHMATCPNCPDPEGHVLRERRERTAPKPLPRISVQA